MASEFEVKVLRKVVEAEGIASFHLVSVDGAPLPAFSAGSHIDVRTPASLVRQYSLCNSPENCREYQIAVLDDPASRGGSASMHREVDEGSLLRIGVPRNHFPLMENAGEPLLLAGGIGITPLLCMAERLGALGAPFEMHYFARSRARAAFIERIGRAPFAPFVAFHFDDEQAAQADLARILERALPSRRLYACGPAGFLEAVRTKAADLGWSSDHVHFEYFSAQTDEGAPASSFTVTLGSSGKVFEIPPDKSIADVLIDNGIAIPVSCAQGVCGTCLTRVLAGVPNHRDLYLTDEEHAANDQITPCCSRALSPSLTLDL